MAANQGAGFETRRKRTRRDALLGTTNVITPRAELCEVVEPHHPKRGNDRLPIDLERMLRIHFIQHWFRKRHCTTAPDPSSARRNLSGAARIFDSA